MSLWPGRSGMCVTATSRHRSGEVALVRCSQIDAERPRHVALTSRSGLRARPQLVALRGRSRLRFVSSRHGNASDLGTSLWQVALRGVSHDRNTSDLSMSLWPGRSGMCVTATSRHRSGEVALVRCSSVDRFKHFF
ncbi:hypothetical protein DY000_02035685 [Brassica cretica]|uniref:Uncharacterized protein n=1 Tax=Brassica cretica TaxID=69181 RepID=A0ABQ7DVW6_BRACR|nr:hypothetical protein DY000_02035685 [Brassica cretica]